MTGGLPSRPAPLAKGVARAAHRWAADRRTNVEPTWSRPPPDRPRSAALAPAHRWLMRRQSRHLCRICPPRERESPCATPLPDTAHASRIGAPPRTREKGEPSCPITRKRHFIYENVRKYAASSNFWKTISFDRRFLPVCEVDAPSPSSKVPRRNEGVHAVDRLVLIVGKWRMGR